MRATTVDKEMHETPSPRKLKAPTVIEKLRDIVMINLVLVMLAGGEGANIVRGEHIGQTAVVCDQCRNDAKVTSDLDNIDFLVKEAWYCHC
jgi:hypothetical protein